MKSIIRYAKAAITLIVTAVTATACPTICHPESYEIKRDCYILGYWDVATQFPELSYSQKDNCIAIECSVIHGIEIEEWDYTYWNRCKYEYDRDLDSEFWRLAKFYGDTGYGKFGERLPVDIPSNVIMESGTTSLDKTISHIEITSDAEWDKNHEAGASLADCFNISYTTFAEYIDNGYAEDKRQTLDEIIMKPLNELTTDDLRLVNVTPLEHSLTLTATAPPTSAKLHNLSIIFYIEDGTTSECTIEVEFP